MAVLGKSRAGRVLHLPADPLHWASEGRGERDKQAWPREEGLPPRGRGENCGAGASVSQTTFPSINSSLILAPALKKT